MNRKEAIELLMKTADELKSAIVDELIPKAIKEEYIDLVEAIEKLNEPLTLADFLGWEENVEYDVTGLDTNIFFFDDIPQRYKKIAKIGSDGYSFHIKAYSHDLAFHTDERINRLRQAEKADPEKYYAIDRIARINVSNRSYLYSVDNRLISTAKQVADKRTLEEWNELGINDTNADFEEVTE